MVRFACDAHVSQMANESSRVYLLTMDIYKIIDVRMKPLYEKIQFFCLKCHQFHETFLLELHCVNCQNHCTTTNHHVYHFELCVVPFRRLFFRRLFVVMRNNEQRPLWVDAPHFSTSHLCGHELWIYRKLMVSRFSPFQYKNELENRQGLGIDRDHIQERSLDREIVWKCADCCLSPYCRQPDTTLNSSKSHNDCHWNVSSNSLSHLLETEVTGECVAPNVRTLHQR